MTTEELRAAKRQMESRMFDAINDFNRDTGLMPESVSIEVINVVEVGVGDRKFLTGVVTVVPL